MGLIKKIYERSKILVLPKLWVKWVEKRTGLLLAGLALASFLKFLIEATYKSVKRRLKS